MSYLPDGLEWGIPHKGTGVYCVRVEGFGKTLCGRRIDHAPILQPANPPACSACLLVLPFKRVPRRPQEYGTCPACGGEAPLAGDVVAKHPAWVMSRNGPMVGKRQCSGEGQEPE